MKDEIKLKDMTDFLENVYKDIKKQPTLEEELEKERKFINKIKGDNEDEIKEILDFDFESQGERIEINEYERDILKDYINNLQEENERLRTKKWQIKTLKEEWLNINENATLVFENNNLIEFMNKLEDILQGDDKDV